jgi:alpha-mannosidase
MIPDSTFFEGASSWNATRSTRATGISVLAKRIQSRIYDISRPVDELLVSQRVERIPYTAAQQLREWRPAKVGRAVRPALGDLLVSRQGDGSEGMGGKSASICCGTATARRRLWIDGKTIQGLNSPERIDAMMLAKARGGETLEFQVEMACNGLFGSVGIAKVQERQSIPAGPVRHRGLR